MSDEKWMDRIQALLNQAASVGLDTPEGKAFQEKAQQLMSGHKIEEAALRARNLAKGFTEIKRHEPTDIRIDWVPLNDEFFPVHIKIVTAFAGLTGVRLVVIGDQGKLHVVGYPDDIDYFRMLWLSSYLSFSGKLFPEWSKSALPGDNIRALVEAGYKWNYIWAEARRQGQPFTRKDGALIDEPPGDNGWMKRELAKAYVRTNEEKPKLSHSIKDYRNSYANGFQDTLLARVLELRYQRDRIESQADSGAALVLKKDNDALTDLYNLLFPPYTLSDSILAGRLQGNHAGAGAAGRSAAAAVDMSGGRGGVGGRAMGEIG